MRKIIISLIIITITYKSSLCQELSDLGKKHFSEIKAKYKIEPCDLTYGKTLTYCVEGGNRIIYLFDNNLLYGIMFQTAFLNKREAEKQLDIEVSNFSKKHSIKPSYGNGMALFTLPYQNLGVSFGIIDEPGTFYLIHHTFLSM